MNSSMRPAAPPDEQTGFDRLAAGERDRAWFFKLFSLRGVREAPERMSFLTFLQEAEDASDSTS